MTKKQTIFFYLIAAVVVVFLFWYQNPPQFLLRPDKINKNITPAIEVENQAPGKFVLIRRIVLPAPGFVVLKQDTIGKSGIIAGYSSLFPAGTSTSLVVVTATPTIVGRQYWATLYLDNGDGKFNADTDTQITDYNGQPISAPVLILDENLLKTLDATP